MIWADWQAFWAMGGYALYVWGSVVVVFAVILGEVLTLSWRRKAIHAELQLARAVRRKAGERGRAP